MSETDPLDVLQELRPGRYRGEGLNHESQPFVGQLELRRVLGDSAWSLEFSAQGAGGEGYHEEETLLGVSPAGALRLVSVNSNDPLLRCYELRRDEEDEGVRRLTFGWGSPEDESQFRCEITLEVYEMGDLGYRYAWGMPGGEFADRSGVRLRPSSER